MSETEVKAKRDVRHIYIHDIVTIWSDNGEIYLHTDTDDLIVINGEMLFNEIPTLMTLALKERRKQEEITLELIENEVNNIKKLKKKYKKV